MKRAETPARAFVDRNHPRARPLPISRVARFVRPIASLERRVLPSDAYAKNCRGERGAHFPLREIQRITKKVRRSTVFDSPEVRDLPGFWIHSRNRIGA